MAEMAPVPTAPKALFRPLQLASLSSIQQYSQSELGLNALKGDSLHLTLDSILQSPLFEGLCVPMFTLIIGVLVYGLVSFLETKAGAICWRILKLLLLVCLFPFWLLHLFLRSGCSAHCCNCCTDRWCEWD